MEAHTPDAKSAAGRGEGAGEYLVFALGAEEYAMDIALAREIRGYGAVTRIACAPDCVKGVINLRGTIVPIIDLRIRFALEEARYDHVTSVIIVEAPSGVAGVVVDGVSVVTRIEKSQIRPVAELERGGETHYLHGIAVLDEGLVAVIDIDRVLRDLRLNSETLQAA